MEWNVTFETLCGAEVTCYTKPAEAKLMILLHNVDNYFLITRNKLK